MLWWLLAMSLCGWLWPLHLLATPLLQGAGVIWLSDFSCAFTGKSCSCPLIFYTVISIVIRTGGQNHQVIYYSTFCPKATFFVTQCFLFVLGLWMGFWSLKSVCWKGSVYSTLCNVVNIWAISYDIMLDHVAHRGVAALLLFWNMWKIHNKPHWPF